MKLFGHLQVRLDPWQSDYGSEIPLELDEQGEADEAVDLGVESDPERWQPITPSAREPEGRTIFVDGVRRLEARLIGRSEDRLFHGAFGSYGVGAVEASAGHAWIRTTQIGRVIAFGSGQRVGPIAVLPSLEYLPISSARPDPDGPLRAIQEQMRLAEERLGKELADAEEALVIVDGPLSFEEAMRGSAIGYIKRLFRLYLPGSHLALLAALQAGQRTPLFALRSSRRFARYSWFSRVGATALGESDLSGIVRLEVAETLGSDRARQLADRSTQMLPRFVPPRWRDPRSPQNLLPIGGLEQHLRHRLGDARLIRRRIQALLAQEAQRV